MRILLVGASGIVGQAAAGELGKRHDIIAVSRSAGEIRADITDPASIREMYAKAGQVDAVVSCAGHVHFGPLTQMTREQFEKGLRDKLMGQVNLVLLGLAHVNDGGSFTLTSGVLDRDPIRGGTSASAVNAALAGFAMAAAIELPRGIRINVVSPGLLEEAVQRFEGFFPGHVPVPSWRVGMAYAKSVEGAITGRVIAVD
jgi:NAD(P)-dependent dehydrogenase (short-subunit alcohol dehydrogenase family)